MNYDAAQELAEQTLPAIKRVGDTLQNRKNMNAELRPQGPGFFPQPVTSASDTETLQESSLTAKF